MDKIRGVWLTTHIKNGQQNYVLRKQLTKCFKSNYLPGLLFFLSAPEAKSNMTKKVIEKIRIISFLLQAKMAFEKSQNAAKPNHAN